jgi:hypothetical protein
VDSKKRNIGKTIEVAGIELGNETNKIIVLTVYRSPSGELDEFFSRLQDILER